MGFEYRAPGATLKAFYESDAFARALIGPIYGGRKTAAVHDILGRLSEGSQPAWRWAAVRATESELRAETIACWQEHFARIFGISAVTPKIWDAKELTARLNTKAGVLELRFFGLDNAAHRRAFEAYQATAYWLDGARDLPESVFDQAIGGAGEYPARLHGGCRWKGVACTSRMPGADHWLAQRFGAVPDDRAARRDGVSGHYALFWQPGGRAGRAENIAVLREKGLSYAAIAAGKPADYVRQYVDAEFGASTAAAAVDQSAIAAEIREAEFTAELWKRLGALDESEDRGEPSRPRRQALAEYREQLRAAGDIRAAARELARGDLFFLLAVVLGRKDVNRDWLFARCREVAASPDGRLDIWGREHYKSTIVTFALTIQDILRDPELTVGLFSFNRPIAKAFLRQIKFEFESNKPLIWLFPDILWENPQRSAPKWSEDEGIVVRRSGNPKEATLEAWGLVDAQPTSKHYRLMLYDDVVTKDSVTTPEMIRKVTESWEASLNLGSDGGRIRYLGTRWAVNDTYRVIIERGAAILRHHPATVDGTADGEPVLMNREALAKKRRDMGPYTFGAQMLGDPTADRAQGFRDEWVRYYEAGGDFSRMNKYLLVDPASAKKRDSDYTAMGVIGLGDDDNYYLLDAIRDRLSLPERGDRLFELHRRWKPKNVGYERYGMQGDVEYLRERMGRENYRFPITEVGGQLAKNDRIKRMIPVFEEGRFYLPETLHRTDYEGRRVDLVQAFLNEEYRPFPVGLHDDFFDMLSRLWDIDLVWPKAAPGGDRYERRRKHGSWRRFSAWAA